MTQDAFGAVLHSLRARAGMKQGELARLLHVHRNTVGAWERGDYVPDLTTVHELVQLLFLDEQEAEQLLAAHSSRTPLVVPWNLPWLRNRFFTGREAVLQRLHERLQAAEGGGSVALCGLGGMGKTQTALEYAYRFHKAYRSLFWVQAESVETLLASFVAIAELLELPERAETDQRQVTKAVRRWLQSHSGWLLIYDNVEDLALLEPYLPAAREGAILLTTRLQSTGSQFPSLELEALPGEEAALLLARRGKLLTDEQTLEQLSPEERARARELAEQLGGLPLALDQAGAYLEEYGCSVQNYQALYQRHRSRLLRERGMMGSDHPASVEATVRLAFEQVARRHPAAADLLCFCAFLAPTAMPQELFWREGEEQMDKAVGPLAGDALSFHALLKDLLRASLIRRETRTQSVSMHRLVQEVLRDGMEPETRRAWLARVIRRLHHLFPPLPLSLHVQEWPLCERLLSHVQVAVSLSEQEQVLLPETAQLCLRAAEYVCERYRYDEALAPTQQALALCERIFGPEHLETAECLTVLSILVRRQGKFEEAERMGQRVLAIRERQLGPNHILIAESLENLAIFAWPQGHNEQAIALLRRALLVIGEPASWEPTFETTVAVNVMSLLARVYASQGDYREAEPLQRQALEISEQVQGTLHPHTALNVSRLGELYQEMGRYAEAEPLMRRALSIREQVFGPDDALTAQSLHLLSQLYLDLGRYAEAEHLLQRALTILDPVHSIDALGSIPMLLTLANLCRLQGKHEQARALGQQALLASEQAFGRRHLRVAQSLVLLGTLAGDQEQFAEAEALLQEAQAIYEEHAVPLADPRVTAALHALGVLSARQGRPREAEQFLRQALALREERLGPEHPHLVESLAELAELCWEQERAPEGETLAQRALSLAEQSLGHEHPLTRKLVRSRLLLFTHQQET